MSRWTRPRPTWTGSAPSRGASRSRASQPIQPFETPYSWVVEVDLDDETIQVVRDLYAAEITYVDAWIGRLMNKLDDEKLLDETVVYYISDHGLTLGEDGVVGKAAARAQWHIYHVPCMIRHPEGKLAGERSDFFASTHDVAPTLLSFMGIRAPGQMTGEDLSVLFDGGRPPDRPHFTACYADYVLAGDFDWFLLVGQRGAAQAPLRQAARPAGAGGRGRPAPRDRGPALAHPGGRGRRHAARSSASKGVVGGW